MAGDWLPMRTNLEDDPTVIHIARVTRLQPDHVVGKLFRFWVWVDSHTADGSLPGIDAEWIDQRVGKRGFAAAMATAPAPWLSITDGKLTIPNFDNWFGSSSKSRLMNTRRQQLSRHGRDECHGDSATKARPPNRREEERLVAPALAADDWEFFYGMARRVADKLGRAGSDRNKRLVLGACMIAEKSLGKEWLNAGIRETSEAKPEKPYAYLRTVLTRTADERGVDFRASVAALQIPKPKVEVPCPE